LTFTRNDDEIDGVAGHLSAEPLIHIYPNPATDYLTAAPYETVIAPCFDYVIYNNSGMIVKHGIKHDWNGPINISDLRPGMYYIRIDCKSRSVPVYDKLLKF
jgi:hypothetical protein